MRHAALAYLPFAYTDIDCPRRAAYVSIPIRHHPGHSGLVQLILSVMLSHGG